MGLSKYSILALCISMVLLSGCAMTTTYGKKPIPDAIEKDQYAFTIYYNAYVADYDIEQKAKQEISKFMSETGYKDFEIVNISKARYFGKVVYEVKFFHEPREK